MSFFACAIQVDGGPAPSSFRAAIETARFSHGKRFRWHTADGTCAVVGLDVGAGRGEVARLGRVAAFGTARIDNRRDLKAWTGCRDRSVSDLELVLRYLADSGAAAAERVGQLLGDFAFVVWDPDLRALLAARDTFGVRTLYYTNTAPNTIAFSSRAELLATSDDYDRAFLVGRVTDEQLDPCHTVYSRIRSVPGASVMTWRDGVQTNSSYWSAREAQNTGNDWLSERDQVDAFRSLLIEGVEARLDREGATWAHLSGGLDSSSIVGVSQWLADSRGASCGLGGTISYVDPLGSAADEREYSDSVVSHCGVRNIALPHAASWSEVLTDPPHFDQPTRSYPVGVRDRRAAAVIRNAGGTTLLSGIGGDHLLLTTMFFFADWVAKGDVMRAVREMVRRAALGRVSFWELAFKNAFLPLLPGVVRRALLPRDETVTVPWLCHSASRHNPPRSPAADLYYGGRRGRKYVDALAATVATLPATLPDRFADDVLDLRHPFLHRPLVEFALRLPPELSARPHERKWILREAMRGLLPESVRVRVGKGDVTGLLRRSLCREERFIKTLLRDPILAQLGCIDARRLRQALANAGDEQSLGAVLASHAHVALDVEFWLQLRSGRWAAEDSQQYDASGKRTLIYQS